MLWTVIILIIGFLAYQHFTGHVKTGYILIQDVYNQFELKKDLQKKYENSHSSRKRILDSLGADIRMLGQKIDAEKGKDTSDLGVFRRKRIYYYNNKQRLDQDDSAQMKQYDDQILSQLNQYVKDYGNENHYQYIFGNTAGSIMQADETLNLTAPITQYVNERYAGKK
jgi:outer membrane protein